MAVPIDVTRFHSSSRKQIEPRQNVGCHQHKQANSRESENGPKSRSHPPTVAVALENRNSNTPHRSLQQRDGEGDTDKIQPRNFTDAHRCCIVSREACQLAKSGVSAQISTPFGSVQI